jgi:hypothetical protein
VPCIAVSGSYFHTRAFLRVFEQDPDVFMSGEVEHPIEEE